MVTGFAGQVTRSGVDVTLKPLLHRLRGCLKPEQAPSTLPPRIRTVAFDNAAAEDYDTFNSEPLIGLLRVTPHDGQNPLRAASWTADWSIR